MIMPAVICYFSSRFNVKMNFELNFDVKLKKVFIYEYGLE